MQALREAMRAVRRRPLRSGLTAAGVAVGVAALVVFGALTEKLRLLVAGGRDFATGQITVSGPGAGAATGMTRGALLSGDQLAALGRVPGIRRVAPIVLFPASDTPSPLPFTLAPMIFGVDVEALLLNRRSVPPRLRSGTIVPEPKGGEVVIGSEVARHYGVDTGGRLTVRGKTFRVAGVLETTLSGPDSFVFMPYPVAQSLLLESEPLLRRLVLVPGADVLPIATAAAVFWKDGEDPEAVADRVRAALPEVSVVSPRDAAAQLDRALVFLISVIVGAGITALVVASLAVANTMFTAVVERRREIGLRRVVGATRRQVVRQLTIEATVLGGAGGLLGLAAGASAVAALNAVTARMGTPVFLVTWPLVVAALAMPPLLAALAGLWPAWRAARLPPTEAVRWA